MVCLIRIRIGLALRPSMQAVTVPYPSLEAGQARRIRRVELSMVIYLVSCVGQELSVPTTARDLYTSPWFYRVRSDADILIWERFTVPG